jgi:hypothetical protein
MMENKPDQPWYSMTPLLCALMPIGIALGLVVLLAIVWPGFFRGQTSCMISSDDVLRGLIVVGSIFLFGVVMVPTGIYSVLSGVDTIKGPPARGKPVIAIAIALGILEIIVGAGCILYLFWLFAKVFG